MSDDLWLDWAVKTGYDYNEDDRSFNEYMSQKLASEEIESGMHDDEDDLED